MNLVCGGDTGLGPDQQPRDICVALSGSLDQRPVASLLKIPAILSVSLFLCFSLSLSLSRSLARALTRKLSHTTVQARSELRIPLFPALTANRWDLSPTALPNVHKFYSPPHAE